MSYTRFADLRHADDLARALGAPAERILAYAQAAPQAAYYDALQIAKRGRRRSGQHRTVYRARDGWLSEAQRMVALMVMQGAPPGEHVQGFVQQRSIVTNARQHVGAAQLLHADIENFFDTISTAQLVAAFVTQGAQAAVADLLARLCTIDGRLRQGTRCGPALANLVCMPLDAALLALAAAHGCVYTRYADDIVLSGARVPASDRVQAVLAQYGFALRDGRCYLQCKGRAQFVTGLHVGNDERPRLPRRMKRRLRLVVHWIRKVGTDAHFAHRVPQTVAGDHDALAGMLRYVQSVEPELARRLRAQFNAGSAKSHALRPPEEDRMDYYDDLDDEGMVR